MGRPFQWSVTGCPPANTGSGTMATAPPTTTSIFTTTATPPATINSTSSLGSFFRFTAGPLPGKLVFPPPPPSSPSGALKRCRSLDDVDGEHSAQFHKKKRRLRLFLITSRLSPVFSQPATYIVDRGSSKIAVWAKQRALGRNLLRKAAILNRIRMREREQQQQQQDQDILQQRQMEMARQTFLYGSHDTLTHPVLCAPRAPFPREKHPPPNATSKPILEEDISTDTTITSPNFAAADAISPNFPPAPALLVVRGPYYDRPPSCSSIKANDGASTVASRKTVPPSSQVPRRDYIPLPPSPLGLSNYDALDLEDDFLADEDDENDADDDASSFSSTFSSTFSSYDDGWGIPKSRQAVPRLVSPSDSPPTIYSDFSVLDPMEAVVDDHDLIEAFAGTSTTAGVGALEEARYEAERKREAERKKAEERMMEIREEKQRQRELLFAGLSTFVV